jgi:hypothetical protein
VASRHLGNGLNPDRRYPVASPSEADAAATPLESEGDANDLWSLPPDTAAPAGTGDDDQLVAAWMGVLANEDPAEPRPAWTDAVDGARPRSLADADTEPVGASRRTMGGWVHRAGWVNLVASVAVSALVGLVMLPVLAQINARLGTLGPDGPARVPSAPADDRVVVPGPSAGCLTMLIKPKPDGVTRDVRGTCFAVG